VQVSNDQAQLPQVAVDSSGNIDVVWNEASSSSPYKPVFFSHSTDGGGTFSTPITVSGNTYFQPEQQMMVDSSGNIYVLESLDPTPNGVDGDIWLARSSDGGATFSLINVSNNPGSNNPNQGRMALDAAGNVSIVWVQLVSSQWQMFYRRSTDGGATFSAPVNVTNGLAGDPQIAVDPTGNVNVVWDQYTGLSQSIDIYFSRSSDGGSTFSSPQNISNNLDPNLNPSIVSSRVPMIAVDSGANVYVVWQDHTGPASVSTPVGNIFFSRGISPFAVTPTPGI